jgi:hypothetical protein
MQTDNHASSGIRTHDLSVWPDEDIDRVTTVIGKIETYNIKMTDSDVVISSSSRDL